MLIAGQDTPVPPAGQSLATNQSPQEAKLATFPQTVSGPRRCLPQTIRESEDWQNRLSTGLPKSLG